MSQPAKRLRFNLSLRKAEQDNIDQYEVTKTNLVEKRAARQSPKGSKPLLVRDWQSLCDDAVGFSGRGIVAS